MRKTICFITFSCLGLPLMLVLFCKGSNIVKEEFRFDDTDNTALGEGLLLSNSHKVLSNLFLGNFDGHVLDTEPSLIL